MICPQTKAEMTCPHIEGCFVVGCNGDCESPPPKPTMAEIERLVDAYGAAMTEYRIHGVVSVLMDARAVLMASIKQYGEG